MHGWSAADVAGHMIGCFRVIEALARGRAALLDPGLVSDALGPARQFAPLARSSGLAGTECTVGEEADDLTRLLAIFGRR